MYLTVIWIGKENIADSSHASAVAQMCPFRWLDYGDINFAGTAFSFNRILPLNHDLFRLIPTSFDGTAHQSFDLGELLVGNRD
jgi:hypothetical protein